MLCQSCGAVQDDNACFCNHCGAAFNCASPACRQKKPPNNLAVIGLVFAFFLPVPGLIISAIARKQCIERDEEGGTLAKAGMIVGGILCILLAAVLLALARERVFF